MDKRYEKRLRAAQNPRLRRHKHKKPVKYKRPKSNVSAYLEELSSGVNPISVPYVSQSYPHAAVQSAVVAPAMLLGGLAAAAVEDVQESIYQRKLKKIRAAALEKRRKYYAADARRVLKQRQEIENAKKPPACKCPTASELIEAYYHRNESDDCKLRFGTLMIDLEEHVARTYVISGNKFVGSNGGVKQWLKKNCSLLSQHYSTCLRYKRLAQDEPPPDDESMSAE